MTCRRVGRRRQTAQSRREREGQRVGGASSSSPSSSTWSLRTADLLKLVHPEDAPGVPAVGAHFLPEAGGEAGVADGKLLGFEPLVSQEGCDGLLRRGDQVLLVDGAVVGLLAALSDHLMTTDGRIYHKDAVILSLSLPSILQGSESEAN